jgi:hypothetical protein
MSPTATTVSVALPTLTPVPPAQDGAGGGCNSTVGRTPWLTGLGNMVFLMAPLGLIVAMRRRRRTL